ncbi:MAG: tRNA glutamyl-Q(34) synthetase GluQRS [Gammaproteobacteria bacterium]|nr:tRNA glutamyl-Q(34) synthetase GluQRS [Gammaproteobacteria bacterium]MDH5240564.1 tRNA glutamyl-Q(34) synthetase GluQRS [Gammaproteobacteria bacterium]MDH5261605.1 tRNA glutamyl-Q(34) synthetase GluQRS [Gammaproteobacteria bacterium]MDH5582524.1 tRNA glutamyl-Q(34) synthetase GluQRS [Gammaproteobacteria bacterium]
MPAREPNAYVGRFAPSPTGPLHFGSLVAAAASFLEARANHGRWLLRIEDIDPPREQRGAAQAIVEALERYGFEWDGDVYFQSASRAAHDAAVATLIERGLAYACHCSRSDLADALQGDLGSIYPGTCRDRQVSGESAIRIRTNDSPIEFEDALQGAITQRLESESGDFVIRRRDGLIAYHLAVVVDDENQGVTDVVRGIDLLDSTPRQIWLQRELGFRTPRYAHIPIITNSKGEKLSKSTAAAAICEEDVPATLVATLRFLRLSPPDKLAREHVSNIWSWALENWQLGKLSGQKTLVKTA